MRLIDLKRAIDLLFTDLVMPGKLSGVAVAEAARARRPDLPVLFTSGFTLHPSVRRTTEELEGEFLPKPYRPSEVLARVRSRLAPAA